MHLLGVAVSPYARPPVTDPDLYPGLGRGLFGFAVALPIQPRRRWRAFGGLGCAW